jgi:hypothetical protein
MQVLIVCNFCVKKGIIGTFVLKLFHYAQAKCQTFVDPFLGIGLHALYLTQEWFLFKQQIISLREV